MKTFDEEEVKELSPLIGRIQQFLVEKSMFEIKRQDENNITSLGGVSFHFKYGDDGLFLCYTTHPKTWNEKDIIDDIEEYERYMAIKKGAQIEL